MKHPDQGEIGFRDPIIITDLAKVNILEKLITRSRQL